MQTLAIVSIRNNATGEVRQHVEARDPLHDEALEFAWSEGNCSCDCNRGLLFAAAAGEDDPDVDCGDDAYTVVSISDEGGRVLYEALSKPT